MCIPYIKVKGLVNYYFTCGEVYTSFQMKIILFTQFLTPMSINSLPHKGTRLIIKDLAFISPEICLKYKGGIVLKLIH